MYNDYPISPYRNWCNGYGGSGNEKTKYILGVTLGIGISNKELSHWGSTNLDEINAFDLAEVDGPYIGQLNMSVVSSFCGPEGMIWGYDIANNLKNRRFFNELNIDEIQYKSSRIKVYDGQFLLDSLEMLFGSCKDKRFNIIPGAHVPFASKNIKVQGRGVIYSSIAIGIPEDRDNNACLLMEDIGKMKDVSSIEEKRLIVSNLARSVIEIGLNQRVKYKECLVLFKSRKIENGEIGCALVAAPYFTIAQNAIPKNILGIPNFEKLKSITLEEWSNSVKIK